MPAQTAKTPGNGSGTLSYTLASDSFDIESVYASIDATAATGPVTAELTVKDQSGVVIARKKQGVTIPAGVAGSATWALRLDDEATAGGLQFDTYPQDGDWLYLKTTNYSGSPNGWGIEFVDDSGGGGINFRSVGWDVELDSTHNVLLKGNGGTSIVSVGSNIGLVSGSGSQMTMTAAGAINVQAASDSDWYALGSAGLRANGDVVISAQNVGSEVLVHGTAGTTIRVGGTAADSLLVTDIGGNPLFRIDGDGSIHGRTAVGAITWDLVP